MCRRSDGKRGCSAPWRGHEAERSRATTRFCCVPRATVPPSAVAGLVPGRPQRLAGQVEVVLQRRDVLLGQRLHLVVAAKLDLVLGLLDVLDVVEHLELAVVMV